MEKVKNRVKKAPENHDVESSIALASSPVNRSGMKVGDHKLGVD